MSQPDVIDCGRCKVPMLMVSFGVPSWEFRCPECGKAVFLTIGPVSYTLVSIEQRQETASMSKPFDVIDCDRCKVTMQSVPNAANGPWRTVRCPKCLRTMILACEPPPAPAERQETWRDRPRLFP